MLNQRRIVASIITFQKWFCHGTALLIIAENTKKYTLAEYPDIRLISPSVQIQKHLVFRSLISSNSYEVQSWRHSRYKILVFKKLGASRCCCRHGHQSSPRRDLAVRRRGWRQRGRRWRSAAMRGGAHHRGPAAGPQGRRRRGRRLGRRRGRWGRVRYPGRLHRLLRSYNLCRLVVPLGSSRNATAGATDNENQWPHIKKAKTISPCPFCCEFITLLRIEDTLLRHSCIGDISACVSITLR